MENNYFVTYDQIFAGIIPCCCIMIVHKFSSWCVTINDFFRTSLVHFFVLFFMRIIGAIKRIIGKMKRIIGKTFKNKRIEY